MLAGIKTGKKKKKKQQAASANHPLASPKEPPPPTNDNNNADVASQLRATLQQGGAVAPPPANTAATIQLPTGSVVGHKEEADMTVAELLVHEKTKRDDLQVRNILKARHTRKAIDSDDEEQMTLQTFQASKRQKQQQKTARPDYQEQMLSKSWWYIESRSFASQRLLVTGNYCTLVLAPHSHSLEFGNHFYLVPIQTASSWRDVEDEAVWAERQQFLNALRKRYNNRVLSWETVLDTKQFYQARLEIVVVNEDAFYDAPLFFKTALNEQAEEWGTHNKLLKIQSLRTSIPKNFSYFYLDYGGKNHYLQVIENKSFPRDFAVDTIAGMLDVTPLRLRKQTVASTSESEVVQEFLKGWKEVDFTLSSKE